MSYKLFKNDISSDKAAKNRVWQVLDYATSLEQVNKHNQATQVQVHLENCHQKWYVCACIKKCRNIMAKIHKGKENVNQHSSLKTAHMCAFHCTDVIHNTAQNSSDTVSSHPPEVIAHMMYVGRDGIGTRGWYVTGIAYVFSHPVIL